MTHIVSLPARLDSAALGPLFDELSQAGGSGRIAVDAAQVTHMGALGAQLILAVASDVRSRGGSLDFVAISDRAVGQLRMMGLTPETLALGVT